MDSTEVLIITKKIEKKYKEQLHSIAMEYDMTVAVAEIVLFLHNNPSLDTARDIVQYRGFMKSAVSKAVEQLVMRGYIECKCRDNDRRCVRLTLTDEARPVVQQLAMIQKKYFDVLFEGITEEDKKKFESILGKIFNNIKDCFICNNTSVIEGDKDEQTN